MPEKQKPESSSDTLIYHFDQDLLQKCQATVNSYLGHFSHARTHKLIGSIWRQSSFLEAYFSLKGHKVVSHFRGLSKCQRLWQQIKWLQKYHPHHYCFIQIGFYYEIFGEHAVSLADLLGFRLLKRWRGFRYACGFPRWRLEVVERELQSRCIPYMIVEQTGRELYKVRERLPSRMVEYLPHHDQD